MDDDKVNPPENQSQPQPIFETESLQPEEVAPELENPEEAASSAPPSNIPYDEGPPPPILENKKRFIFIGVGAILFLTIFFLIIRLIFGLVGSKEPVTLTYWGLWEDKEMIDPLIQEYQSKNKNIKINYQKLAPIDYREKLLAQSRNNKGPDIFRFHNTWIPEIKDLVSPLPNSVMSSVEFDKTFYAIHKKDLSIGDSYYGIPLTIDGLVMLYNEGMFRKAGINSGPVTWDDVVNNAAKFSVKDKNGQIITSGIALGTASNVEHFSDIFGLFLALNNVTIKQLDQPAAVTALEVYRKFAEPPNNVWDETVPNSITAFVQEKVAMIIVPSWEILSIKAANPDLPMKVIPIPVIPGPGSKPVSLASYWVEGVSKFSKNQKEAWMFLKFLSEKESMTKSYQIQSKTRLFGEPYSRKDLGNLLVQDEYVGVVIKQADSYVSYPTISRTYDNGLNDEIGKSIENAINATIQGVGYENALSTAKENIDRVLSKFNIN